MTLRACIDCGCDIAGERLRCTRCHDRFARTFPELAEAEETEARTQPSRLLAMLLWSEAITIGVLGLVVLWRAC